MEAAAANNPRMLAGAAFDAGQSAFDRGDYPAAIEHFERAQSLVPHPDTQYNLGMALWRAQQRPRAWEFFNQLARSAKNSQVRADARKRQAELEKELALLRLMTDRYSRICLDGAELGPSEREARIPLEAGPHEVLVDHRRVELELAAGELRVVHIQAELESPAPQRPAIMGLLGTGAASSAIAVGLGSAAATTDSSSRSKSLAIGAASAAAVGLITSAAAIALHANGRSKDTGDEQLDPCAPPGSARAGSTP
jgi:hypothetical protein